MVVRQRTLLLAAHTVLAVWSVCATASAQQSDKMLLYAQGGLKVRAHLQAGVYLGAERDAFWDLASTFATQANYNPDKTWFEGYVTPGLSFERAISPQEVFYGKASAVLSGTASIDPYDYGDTGRLTLEEAYLGYRVGTPDGVMLDLSGGARELVLGTGMLFANGGSSGFERGALKLGPRKAWERAAIARVAAGGWTSTSFYLDANETESNDAKTTLAGSDLRFDSGKGGYAGLTFAHILNSQAPYPQAAPGGIGPPGIIPNGREGLNTLSGYARTDPFTGALKGWFAAVDGAYEWKEDIDLRAWGGRTQIGYRFENHPWVPSITYSYQTFSGDDPDTATLERFDPLFFDGKPANWATGSKSAMTFINSNVNSHQIALSISPTKQDTFILRYAHIRANELRSPIQFGQSTRFEFPGGNDNIVAGVTDAHLADDIYLEYIRIQNANTYITMGISASLPGKGLELAVPDGDLPVWLGAYTNVVINY